MGLRLLLFFFFLLSFLSSFSITQPSSAGRGPFASLARGQPSPRAFVTRSPRLSKGRTCSALLSSSRMRGSMLGFPSVFFRVLPWLMLLLSSFSFCLLMRVCLKTERLRWGSPTATAPFAPLDFGICAFVTRSLSLSKGQPSHRALVILANAGK